MTVHLRVYNPDQGMLSSVYPESFQFPGGEWHLRDIPIDRITSAPCTLIADWRGADPDDLVRAAMWADVARQHLVGFVLMVPYTPAARADRGMPMGVDVYARLIQAMSPDWVITLDPHSPKTSQVYGQQLRVADVIPLIQQATADEQWTGVICPDKGALDRAGAVGWALDLSVVVCDKTRDFDTGRILDLKVPKLDPDGRYLVVDDICDGGGTFKLLAQKSRLAPEQLGLWVTHGIFSGAAVGLREYYGWIGTTDSHPGCFRPGVAVTIVPCFDAMYTEMRKAHESR